MSVSDLDVPLLPSAEQIRRREFASVRRGYDPDQVRDYLKAVAAQVETLEKKAHEGHAQEDPSTAPPPAASEQERPVTDPYEELAKRVATLISTADREAERLVKEAKAEASRMVGESRAEADRIRLDAQARAEEARNEGDEALEKAKIEADRTLANLSSRRETLVSQLHEMQSRLLSVAQDLEATIEDRDGGAEAGTSPEAESNPSDTDIVDPRTEDLWVSTETVDLPELASIDFDFDEDTPDPDA